MKRYLVCSLLLLGAALPLFADRSEDTWFDRQVQALQSPDGSIRLQALSHLEAYGASADEAFLQALKDPSDLISRRAQDAFIRRGRLAVPFLADALASTPEDVGFYARIAGGREQHRGKSIASALWLTLGRGTAPELRLGELDKLLSHASPRVRAVAVYTAATLRSSEFVPILKKAADDEDPLVRDVYRRALIMLLMQSGYATPSLDAATEAAALDLFAAQLVAAAEDTLLGYSDGEETFGEIVGRGALKHHGERYRDLLREALKTPGLSPFASRNLGGALVKHSEPEELTSWIEELLETAPASLAAFPGEAFTAPSLKLVLKRLKKRPGKTLGDAHSAALFLSTAISRAGDFDDGEAITEQAGALLRKLLDDEPTAVRAFAVDFGRAIRRPDFVSAEVRDAALPQLDALWKFADEGSVEDLCADVRIFQALGDERAFDLFQRAWTLRDEAAADMRDEKVLGSCLSFYGWNVRDPRLIEVLRPYLASAADREHTWMLDASAAVLLGALGGHHASFWSDEVFATWMSILENPEAHPRLRARMTMLIASPALTEEQSREFRNALIRIASGPADVNLRDKILTRMLYAGDLRVLPQAYALLNERDQVHWAFSNIVMNLPRAGWVMENDELIEILDGMVRRYGPPDDEVKLVVANNYFNWGVQYQIYPPRRIADELKRRTGEDFGVDVEAWRAWLKKSQEEAEKVDETESGTD